MGTHACEECGFDTVGDSAKACPKCGSTKHKTIHICASCGFKKVPNNAEKCPECGEKNHTGIPSNHKWIALLFFWSLAIYLLFSGHPIWCIISFGFGILSFFYAWLAPRPVDEKK